MAQVNENKEQPTADSEPLSAIAALMVKEEDWAIFRRFDKFNLLNLLILQDEIQELTDQLEELRPSTPGDSAADANMWYMLARPTTRKDETAQNQVDQRLESRRRDIWGKAREKLKEYSEPSSLQLHPS